MMVLNALTKRTKRAAATKMVLQSASGLSPKLIKVPCDGFVLAKLFLGFSISVIKWIERNHQVHTPETVRLGESRLLNSRAVRQVLHRLQERVDRKSTRL